MPTKPHIPLEIRKRHGSAQQRRAALALFSPSREGSLSDWREAPQAEKANGGAANSAAATCPPALETPLDDDKPYQNSAGIQGFGQAATQSRVVEGAAGDPHLLDEGKGSPAAGGTLPPKAYVMPQKIEKKPALPQPVNMTEAQTTTVAMSRIFGPMEMHRGDPDRWLCDVYFAVSGFRQESGEDTQYKTPYVRWLGAARCIVHETGEVVEAPTLILPKIASDTLMAAYTKEQNSAHGLAQNVEGGFRLGITTKGKVGSRGYAWTMRVILEPNHVSPLDRFMASATGRIEEGRQIETGDENVSEAAE
jgi:hypothetical protein